MCKIVSEYLPNRDKFAIIAWFIRCVVLNET